MPGGNVGHGGGGFSGGHSGGFSGGHSHSHSSGNGLLTGLIVGSLLSRNSSGSSSSGSSRTPVDPTQGGKYRKVKNKTLTYVISAIFLALTILFVGLSIAFRFENVYVLVSAKAVKCEVDTSSSTYSHKYYYTSYNFTTLNGENMFGVRSQISWDGLDDLDPADNPYSEDQINEIYLKKSSGYRDLNIYYLKSNPSIIYDEAAKVYDEIPSKNGVFIFFAVICGIVTLLVFFVGISKYELNPEYVREQTRLEKQKVPQGKRRCSYCGSVFDEKEDKCPDCGASQK